jgi:hypothetical protein
MTERNAKAPRKIEIELDGEVFEVDDREMTVEELLALVELDPAEHYLIELRGQSNEQVNHEDAAETIKLHKRMRFITGDRAAAPVA